MELLAPAGNYQAALSAINGGADALYLGGKKYSARMNADNFSDDEMIKILDYAHFLGKKVYVTMNTLLYQDEFLEAVEYAKFLYHYGVDALIIQDLGLARYLHCVLPDLVLHASTQLNCHNLDQAKALYQLGFKRVVLAREAPLSLIKEIKEIGLEVEVFVHGALCVSYSGNCLMSSFIGSRSGNRGRCAQPCRLEYQLLKDNKPMTSKSYLISTKDLNDLDYIPQILHTNVDSLKIEGRLKQNEYVYLVCKAYSNAIKAFKKQSKEYNTNVDQKTLKQIFSRSFTKGFMMGASSFEVINTSSSSHQGESIGRVVSFKKERVGIKLSKDVHRLDGIRFNDENQYGRQIQKMFVNSKERETAKAGEIIEITRMNIELKLNTEVIRTSTHQLMKKTRFDMVNSSAIEVTAKIYAFKNKPLRFEIRYGKNVVGLTGNNVEQSLKDGTSSTRIIEQFKKTGNYFVKISSLDFKGDNDIFIPISSINELRNKVLDLFIESRKIRNEIKENLYQAFEGELLKNEWDYLFVNDENNTSNITVYPLNENYHFTSRILPKGLLNKNHSYVSSFYLGNDLIASPYCNITNSYALEAYYEAGYSNCALSLELDRNSINLLINDYFNRHQKYPNVSLYLYGKIDMMIMKSCPIGVVHHNQCIHCQKCHLNKYELKDRIGVNYLLKGDENCNVRIINDKPISLINYLSLFRRMHINNFIIHFVDEDDLIVNKIKDHLIKNKTNLLTLNNTTLGHIEKRAL